MGTIRAKYTCVSVTKYTHNIYSATFQPVVSGSEENKRFFASTPSGQIVLQSIVSDLFEPGREYYVEFAEAANGPE